MDNIVFRQSMFSSLKSNQSPGGSRKLSAFHAHFLALRRLVDVSKEVCVNDPSIPRLDVYAYEASPGQKTYSISPSTIEETFGRNTSNGSHPKCNLLR
jgi:hypothetical protein